MVELDVHHVPPTSLSSNRLFAIEDGGLLENAAWDGKQFEFDGHAELVLAIGSVSSGRDTFEYLQGAH